MPMVQYNAYTNAMSSDRQTALESSEGIPWHKTEIVIEASRTMPICAAAMLTATSAPTVHWGLSRQHSPGIIGSIVDERLHANGTHGIKEVLPGRGAGLRGSCTGQGVV